MVCDIFDIDPWQYYSLRSAGTVSPRGTVFVVCFQVPLAVTTLGTQWGQDANILTPPMGLVLKCVVQQIQLP